MRGILGKSRGGTRMINCGLILAGFTLYEFLTSNGESD